MTITAIKQTSPDRLTVCTDSGEEIKTNLGIVTEFRLYAGRELDDAELGELKARSGQERAKERALELLSRRMLSAKELRERLERKGEDEQNIEACIQWLSQRGFLDEEEYAAALSRHYAAKGYGAGRLKAELSRRGVERQYWDEAIEQMPENDAALDRFISARLKDPDDREQIRKISAALYRRGYSWEQIRQALRRFNAQEEDY